MGRIKIKSISHRSPEDQAILAEIISCIRDGRSMSGPDGIMTKLMKQALETCMAGELDSHLENEESDNRRNGYNMKTVKSGHGKFELATPRDRNSTYEPELVKKRQVTIPTEIEKKILSLYSIGTSYEDISGHIEEMYGIEISDGTISTITDKLLPKIVEWRSRPLEMQYAIVFLDAMFFKAREDGAVKTKVVYNIMGVNMQGHKEILGFYVCESEGASFWLGVLNDLKNRGVQDILISCIDGLKGFPEAIKSAFPKTELQLCIVHQIRNSFKFVPSKNQKEFIQDLKLVYTASSIENAQTQLNLLLKKWAKYHMALKSWVDNWEHLSTFFKFSPGIRRII
jgi:putative transposase